MYLAESCELTVLETYEWISNVRSHFSISIYLFGILYWQKPHPIKLSYSTHACPSLFGKWWKGRVARTLYCGRLSATTCGISPSPHLLQRNAVENRNMWKPNNRRLHPTSLALVMDFAIRISHIRSVQYIQLYIIFVK